MTVSSSLNRKEYAGDDVTTSFGTSPVVFFATSDLQVYVVNDVTEIATLLTEGVKYTVSGGAGATGTVNLAGGSAPHGALLTGTTLLILRVVPLTQGVDLVNNDISDAEVIEDALDRLVMSDQQLQEQLDRSVKVAVGAATDPDDLIDGITTVANAAAASAVAADASASAAASSASAASSSASAASSSASAASSSASAAASSATDSANSATASASSAAASAASAAAAAASTAGRGHLWGLTLSNDAGDVTNDINITAGEATNDANTAKMVLATEITKRLDASWAVGDDQGGLDTGAIANDTYHVWLIRRSDTGVVDALFSLSATSPTMPTNYDQKRRIGSIMRAAGAIRLFVQNGSRFSLSTPVNNVSGAASTSATTVAVTVPAGVIVEAVISASLLQASADAGSNYLIFSSPLVPAVTPTNSLHNMFTNSSVSAVGEGDSVSGQYRIPTNTASQIRHQATRSTNTTLNIMTFGWIDERGRLS